MSQSHPVLPHDFVWGAATAAYQIEGATQADGKLPSIWDTWAHTPGAVINGENGDTACDSYRRWHRDIELLTQIGANAYRFSLPWSRLIGEDGTPNPTAWDHYSAMVDALLEAGIDPYVTLYHWDLPQYLEDQGGWRTRSVVGRFEDFASAAVAHLGDRVASWATFNEPWVSAFAGHWHGEMAPGHHSLSEALQVAHHLLLAHGHAVDVLRTASRAPEVGIALNIHPAVPATATDRDAVAARVCDGHYHRWFLDPLFGRGYPADLLELYGNDASSLRFDEISEAARPLDYLGVNFYFPLRVRHDPTSRLGFRQLTPQELADDQRPTIAGWEVLPAALSDALVRLHDEYPTPGLYVTENGASGADELVDGQVRDVHRVDYLSRHLEAALDARRRGAPVRGYFVWTLMDNFEWAQGYRRRFGLFRTDFQTLDFVPKDSARWFKAVSDTQGSARVGGAPGA